MINIYEIYKLVVANILEKKKRVFLTISGIIIGIFVFTFFIFVSQGLSNAIFEQFSSFGVNVIGVRPVSAPNGPPGGEGITDTDIEKIKQVISNYNYVAGGIGSSFLYEYGREKEIIVSLGYQDEYWDDISSEFGIEIMDGRNLRNTDSGSVILGYKIAKDLFAKEIKVGSSLKVADRSYRVIGIIKERGDLFIDNSLIMPFNDIKQLSKQDTYSLLRISFIDGVDLEFMKNAIDTKLNPKNKERVVNISTPNQAIEQFNMILGVLTIIISFISGIALIVGGINVMNTMYSNILERMNEISVLKAIGATNQDIRNLFLFESSILGLIGSLLGFLFSFLLSKFLSSYILTLGYNVPIYFEFSFFLKVIIFSSIFTMICGTYPAIKAAKINPSDNLRDE